jgi:hypothetical protein
MRDAFTMMWRAFATIFTAVDRTATAVDHAARWAEIEARYLADSAEESRSAELADLADKLKAHRADD